MNFNIYWKIDDSIIMNEHQRSFNEISNMNINNYVYLHFVTVSSIKLFDCSFNEVE